MVALLGGVVGGTFVPGVPFGGKVVVLVFGVLWVFGISAMYWDVRIGGFVVEVFVGRVPGGIASGRSYSAYGGCF